MTTSSEEKLPQAQPPIELEGTHVEKPHDVAAGLPGIWHSMRISFQEMGMGRTVQTLLALNKKDGFDCQSCAWPSPDEERKVAEFCENGAKATATEATTHRVDRDFFAKYSVTELAAQSDHWLDKQGRLTEPMVLREGATHYESISWADAFALIGRELNALASPNEAAFYTSGRTSNEAAFLYQLFVRQFGTNNLPDCSNMCHESSGVALNESIGVGKTTVSLEDFEHADLVLCVGQNPGTNHPRMMSSLEHAKRNGAKVIAINPLPETGLLRVINPNPQEYDNILKFPLAMMGQGTELADLLLQLRINSDVAVFKGLMKVMLEEDAKTGDVIDRDFIAQHAAGFDELVADLHATSWDSIVECSGLGEAQIREVGQIVARAKRMIVCWAMGLTQHKNAVGTIQTMVNLVLLGGHIGRQGAGLCCVRGHSNVQGDRTMGIWEKMPNVFLDALGKEFGFEPPREHGYDTVQTIQAMHAGRVSVFFGMGGNFLSATPDTEFTAAALRRCALTAHVSTKLNRSHLIAGKQALILPCLGRTERDVQSGVEQFVTVEDSMLVINPSRGVLPPASEHLMSEPAIVAGMAKATLGNRSAVDWDGLVCNYDYIRMHISHVVKGFDNFNERIRKDVFYLPNAARERVFNTPSRKAHFYVHPLPDHDLQRGQLMMMTIRSHDQFNTTIYGLDDRYRGVKGGRRVIFMNRDDLTDMNIHGGELVDITSYFNGELRVAEKFITVPFDIPRKCCATYFPEANVLVPIGSTAEKSNTPTSKSVVVSVRRSA
jgi:molybdopterin-dependent oxidoreductase alpha subunit